jgi:hypothetical protein
MLNALIHKARAVQSAIVLGVALTGGGGAASAQPSDLFSERMLNGLPAPIAAASHLRTQRLLVGTGSEVRATALTGGRAPDAARIHASPGSAILRMRIDARRDRLWILDTDAVHVIDLAKNQRLAKIALPNWFYANDGTNCLPDLQLDRQGAAVVSDTMQPKLWRIDADRFGVQERSLSLSPATAVDAGFSALAIGEDGAIFAAMAAPGFLWRVDSRLARAERVQLNEPLQGACAMEVVASTGSRQQTLFVLASGRGGFGVRRVDLASPWSTGRVSDAMPRMIAAPAGIVAADDALHLVLRGPSARELRMDNAAFVLRRIHKLDSSAMLR